MHFLLLLRHTLSRHQHHGYAARGFGVRKTHPFSHDVAAAVESICGCRETDLSLATIHLVALLCVNKLSKSPSCLFASFRHPVNCPSLSAPKLPRLPNNKITSSKMTTSPKFQVFNGDYELFPSWCRSVERNLRTMNALYIVYGWPGNPGAPRPSEWSKDWSIAPASAFTISPEGLIAENAFQNILRQWHETEQARVAHQATLHGAALANWNANAANQPVPQPQRQTAWNFQVKPDPPQGLTNDSSQIQVLIHQTITTERKEYDAVFASAIELITSHLGTACKSIVDQSMNHPGYLLHLLHQEYSPARWSEKTKTHVKSLLITKRAMCEADSFHEWFQDWRVMAVDVGYSEESIKELLQNAKCIPKRLSSQATTCRHMGTASDLNHTVASLTREDRDWHHSHPDARALLNAAPLVRAVIATPEATTIATTATERTPRPQTGRDNNRAQTGNGKKNDASASNNTNTNQVNVNKELCTHCCLQPHQSRNCGKFCMVCFTIGDSCNCAENVRCTPKAYVRHEPSKQRVDKYRQDQKNAKPPAQGKSRRVTYKPAPVAAASDTDNSFGTTEDIDPLLSQDEFQLAWAANHADVRRMGIVYQEPRGNKRTKIAHSQSRASERDHLFLLLEEERERLMAERAQPHSLGDVTPTLPDDSAPSAVAVILPTDSDNEVSSDTESMITRSDVIESRRALNQIRNQLRGNNHDARHPAPVDESSDEDSSFNPLSARRQRAKETRK